MPLRNADSTPLPRHDKLCTPPLGNQLHDHFPAPILTLAERFRVGQLIAGGGALAGLSLLGLPFAEPVLVDAALVLLAAGLLGCTSGLIWLRHQLQNLPLVLAPIALRGRVGEVPIFRFRGWLGRGRPLLNAHATITFTGAHGSVDFVVDAPIPHMVGPWTIILRDPERLCQGTGQFRVRLAAAGTDPVEAIYASTEEGRFSPGFSTSPVQFDIGTWHTVDRTSA